MAAHYRKWPRIVELCAEPPSNGLMEKRGGALVDMDRSALQSRMRVYLDRRLDWGAYVLQSQVLTQPQARFDPEKAREKLLRAEQFQDSRTVRYAVRPLDTRWC